MAELPGDPVSFGVSRGAELARGFGLGTLDPGELEEVARLVIDTFDGTDAHPAALAVLAECTVVAQIARRRSGSDPVDEHNLSDFGSAFAQYSWCIFHP
jgi:hypothetical protein